MWSQSQVFRKAEYYLLENHSWIPWRATGGTNQQGVINEGTYASNQPQWLYPEHTHRVREGGGNWEHLFQATLTNLHDSYFYLLKKWFTDIYIAINDEM